MVFEVFTNILICLWMYIVQTCVVAKIIVKSMSIWEMYRKDEWWMTNISRSHKIHIVCTDFGYYTYFYAMYTLCYFFHFGACYEHTCNPGLMQNQAYHVTPFCFHNVCIYMTTGALFIYWLTPCIYHNTSVTWLIGWASEMMVYLISSLVWGPYLLKYIFR
jgi:hypothetical protein